MSYRIPRRHYTDIYGPTTGDRVRLGVREEHAPRAGEADLVPVPQLALRHHLPVHAREVGRAEVADDEGIAAALDAGVGPGHQRLVDPDLRGLVASHEHRRRYEGELHACAIRLLPDQPGRDAGHG